MTLKPIPGAPIGAPIPDFPTIRAGARVVPASCITDRPVKRLPFPLPLTDPSPTLPRAGRLGVVEFYGSGNSILTFRAIPEIPAINRSSMTISITGQPAGEHSPQTMPTLDLSTDEAKAFLLALRDGQSPIVIADSRNAFQVEFTILENGPTFTVSMPGQEHTLMRFNLGWSYEVKAMADHLLADLGV